MTTKEYLETKPLTHKDILIAYDAKQLTFDQMMELSEEASNLVKCVSCERRVSYDSLAGGGFCFVCDGKHD